MRTLVIWRCAALSAAVFTLGAPALQAWQGDSPEAPARSSLARRVRLLEEQLQEQQELISGLQTALAGETTHRELADAALRGDLEAEAAAREGGDAALQAGLTPVQQKLARVVVRNGGDDLYLIGANLHVVNGLESTDSTNGLGNLIVGYNELRGNGADHRSGSHNLVVGRFNNYLKYGGLVAGETNEVSGAFASVAGGHGGVASGDWAAVTGGHGNTASGLESTVTGGWANLAFGAAAAVTGGDHNVASGNLAVVTGGAQNQAMVGGAVVSGGQGNEARGVLSVVGGGWRRAAPGDLDWVAGGLFQDF
ncbi:MAG: hypothetical protein ACK47B_04875 [Armatimonadota bacterium]